MRRTAPYFGLSLAVFASFCLSAKLLAQPRLPDSLLYVPAPKTLVQYKPTGNCNRDAIVLDYKRSIDSTFVSNTELAWTGDVATCTAGDISAIARQKTLIRINYFRRLVGVWDSITFRSDWNQKCQEAALMMKANNMLSHAPPNTWLCYTANGAEAAGKSNISIGGHSSASVNQYIQDGGSNNSAVGHRRWILYHRGKEFGFGSTNSTTAMWVIGGSQTPKTIPEYIAYPAPGYFPKPLVYTRWSFSVPNGNFANATVEMFDEQDNPYTVNVESKTDNGYGDNTIVWNANTGTMPLVIDRLFRVKVNNVMVGTTPKSFEYKVLAITPSYYKTDITKTQPSCGLPNGKIKASYAPGYKKIEWSTGAINQDSVENLTAGTYYVTVTDKLDCAKTDTIVLMDTSQPATAAIAHDGDLNLCPGEQLQLTASGGNKYQWSTNASTPAITVGAAGNYTVTVTNADGCTDTETLTLVAVANPTVGISPAGPTEFCAGQSATLTASGGNAYQWNTAGTDSLITVSASGIYTVTVTNTFGCSATATRDVTAHPLPTATITPNGPTALCVGSSVALQAGGGYIYLWSNGFNSTIITVSNAGTYTVTATDTHGCTASTSQTVTVHTSVPVAISAAGPTTFCAGQSVELTASGGATYQWSTNTSGPSVQATSSGLYTVTATDAFGCTGTNTASITVNPVPPVAITTPGPTAICAGQSLPLTASGGDTYKWNTGSTDPLLVVSTAGTYTVTATNAIGCTASATFNVGASPPPVATITPNGPTDLCVGNSVQLMAGGGYSYAWNNGLNSATITVSAGGTYTVTASDAAGCTASVTQTITVHTAVPVAIAPAGPTAFCAGQSVKLTASGGSTYQWSTNASGPTITANTSGNYLVTATDAFGCTGTASQNVVVHPVPVATIIPSGPTEYCAGQTLELTATGGDIYLWNTNATAATVNAAQSGTYTVTVSNNFGCSATASQSVTVHPSPTVWIKPSGSTNLCEGQVVYLVAIGAGPYLWNTGSTDNVITVSTAGPYGVTVTNSFGCSDSDALLVTVSPSPDAVITPAGSTDLCAGKSVQLTASGGATYKWSTGATTSAITASSSGNYAVTVTNAAGCFDVVTQTVTVHPSPTVSLVLSGSTNLCSGQSVLFTASGGDSYLWSTGTADASVLISNAGTYTVTATSAFGCTGTLTQAVTVMPSPVLTGPISGNASPLMFHSETYSIPDNVPQYSWQVTGGTITTGAGTKSITVKWAGANTGTVCVTGIGANGCPSNLLCKDIKLEFAVGTDEAPAASPLFAYPNPFTDQLRLEMQGLTAAPENSRVGVFNSLGRLVFDGPVTAPVFDLELTELPSGLYLLVLQWGEMRYTARVIKD